MYCVKCGVKLAGSENVCPLCGTRVYHPDIPQDKEHGMYPSGKYPKINTSKRVTAIVLTVLYAIPLITVILCDFHIYGAVTWSGYVVGALIWTYVSFVLPMWFNKPNPVIFVPCSFVAAGLYVLYIDLAVDGGWYLSFAFPLVGIVGLTVTAVVTLLRYIKKGELYIIGGAFALVGLSMLPMEFLASYTFGVGRFIGWSIYPLASLVLIGAFLIFLAVYRPARDALEKFFFI